MCGIIGFVNKKNVSIKDIFQNSYPSIIDRGIVFDSVNFRNEAYGFSRLPTDALENTDLHTLQKINEGYFLFNGLITNVPDLRNLFELPNSSSESDTLSLGYGYSIYGRKFLSHCRGMFAFAYVTKNTIILARDTIGIKPLYYINSEKIFGFCSEIKGLGIYEGNIEEVLPGELIIYNKKTKKVTKEKFVYKTYKNYTKEDLQDCLVESIILPTTRYLQQTKDKRIGILLSGGIDSSLIFQIIRMHLSKDLQKRIVYFTLGTNYSSDKIFVKKLIKKANIDHVEVMPYSSKNSLLKLPELIYKVESSLSRVIKVSLLQDALAKKMQDMGLHVVISGEGADELFYGYERFINGLNLNQVKEMYTYFFSKVFYYTLLQRYERTFARRQIEGRVPFLDQELILVSKKISPEEKIGHFEGQLLSKLPLRIIGKLLGLHKEIYLRKKEKMTVGATKYQNTLMNNGYLEKYVQNAKGVTCEQFINDHYNTYFKNNKATFKSHYLGTEESAMEKVNLYRELNLKKRKKVFVL